MSGYKERLGDEKAAGKVNTRTQRAYKNVTSKARARVRACVCVCSSSELLADRR